MYTWKYLEHIRVTNTMAENSTSLYSLDTGISFPVTDAFIKYKREPFSKLLSRPKTTIKIKVPLSLPDKISLSFMTN
jgi:hypothetical protein